MATEVKSLQILFMFLPVISTYHFHVSFIKYRRYFTSYCSPNNSSLNLNVIHMAPMERHNWHLMLNIYKHTTSYSMYCS